MVCPDDTGGGIVILDQESYTEEMYRILSDVGTFSVMLGNPTCKFKKELQFIIEES